MLSFIHSGISLDNDVLTNGCLSRRNDSLKPSPSNFEMAFQAYENCSTCGKPFTEVMGSCRDCGTGRPTGQRDWMVSR